MIQLKTKAELRKELQAVLNNTPIDLASRSSTLLPSLRSLVGEHCKAVAGFCAYKQELDLRIFWEELLKRGIALYFPRHNQKTGSYEFARVYNLSEDLVAAQFGILEPRSTLPSCVDPLDLVFVPGLGFTQAGQRLGRGRGDYDKLLVKTKYARQFRWIKNFSS